MKPVDSRPYAPLHRLGALAALLGALGSAVAQTAPPPAAPWQLQLRTDRHSDFLTLKQLDDEAIEHLHARSGRNLAYIDDEVRMSHARGPWTWSLLARSTATLVVNRDAIELVRHATTDPSESDRQWQVDARLRGFTGGGLEVRRSMVLGERWQASVSAQALTIARWRDRSIQGQVQFDAQADRYEVDVRSTETYDGLEFPFQQDFASRGAGLLFGAELVWQAQPFTVALSARDAGWLRWNGIPKQEMVLSTSTEGRDADGFVIYRPLIQGQNSQTRRTERWPVRWALKGRWQATPHGALGVSVDTLPGFGLLPGVSWRQNFGALETGLGWRFHERRAVASLAWKGLQLQFGADRLGSDASSRMVGLSYGAAL
ncbi:hypothetical protein [Caldimonas brevitalea]|uniref:Uncharacterized protein n=1 Tax=Caldimonas brevitalea TaxID=413882 RepID=A0A0G3BMB2_9BURK|nr:hypothetical protein [Caldimonas brevitalea]AKJ30547.1 hypothetical protein AAW51_3856 [Caldimonas brevitalea]